MPIINMSEARSILSKLITALEAGTEAEIIITRNGRPVAKLVAVKPALTGTRIGIAKGKFVVPDTVDDDAAMITKLFVG